MLGELPNVCLGAWKTALARSRRAGSSRGVGQAPGAYRFLRRSPPTLSSPTRGDWLPQCAGALRDELLIMRRGRSSLRLDVIVGLLRRIAYLAPSSCSCSACRRASPPVCSPKVLEVAAELLRVTVRFHGHASGVGVLAEGRRRFSLIERILYSRRVPGQRQTDGRLLVIEVVP